MTLALILLCKALRIFCNAEFSVLVAYLPKRRGWTVFIWAAVKLQSGGGPSRICLSWTPSELVLVQVVYSPFELTLVEGETTPGVGENACGVEGVLFFGVARRGILSAFFNRSVCYRSKQ